MSNTNATGALFATVEGVGLFAFAHRTMRNQIAIECEYSRLTEGMPYPTEFLGHLAQTIADLTILIVSAPKGWGKTPDGKPTDDISEMDAFSPETLDLLTKVWSALRDKEADFRRGSGSEGTRTAPAQQDESVVPPPVQPAADGPAVP